MTGGGTGIGLAIARRFVREGAYVFIVERRQRALDDAVAMIGKNVAAVQGDVTQAGDIDRVFESVRAAKGKLDTLVVDAGIAEPSTLDPGYSSYAARHDGESSLGIKRDGKSATY
jgi:NAD(P)-dependent dehydrogenase (short-subunit alcohol dehydrogenase family)